MTRSINDLIYEAYEQAKKTGKRAHLEFPKRDWILQNPDTPGDPRLAFTGDVVVLDFETYEEIKVDELRKICRDNRDHPLSSQKLMSVMGLPPNSTVVVLKQDLIALREGKAIVSTEVGTSDASLEIPTAPEANAENLSIPVENEPIFEVEGNQPNEATEVEEAPIPKEVEVKGVSHRRK
jgi:hypothetical protein